jgi:hypothetical protein
MIYTSTIAAYTTKTGCSNQSGTQTGPIIACLILLANYRLNRTVYPN